MQVRGEGVLVLKRMDGLSALASLACQAAGGCRPNMEFDWCSVRFQTAQVIGKIMWQGR